MLLSQGHFKSRDSENRMINLHPKPLIPRTRSEVLMSRLSRATVAALVLISSTENAYTLDVNYWRESSAVTPENGSVHDHVIDHTCESGSESVQPKTCATTRAIQQAVRTHHPYKMVPLQATATLCPNDKRER